MVPATAVKVADLAGVMQELGCGCTKTVAAFSAVVAQADVVDEASAARVTALLLRGSTGGSKHPGTEESLANVLGIPEITETTSRESSWNLEVVAEVLLAKEPNLDAETVADHLDQDDFYVKDQKAFSLLMRFWSLITKSPFPIKVLLGKTWQNAAGQLSMLRQAAVASPNVFSFEAASEKILPLEGLHAGKSPYGLPNHAWLCIGLYKVLANLMGAGYASEIHQILEHPYKHCPEVLCVGLASTPFPSAPLHQRMCKSLVIVFLRTHPDSAIVLSRVWSQNRVMVIEAMVAFHKEAETNIFRVLDVCKEHDVLATVLESTPFDFAIELAAVYARHEKKKMENWLQERMSVHSLAFLLAVLRFARHKVSTDLVSSGHSENGIGEGKVHLSLETLAIFLQVLQLHSQGAPPDVLSDIAQLKGQALIMHPELEVLIIEAAAASSIATPAASFPADIEEEANAYFQKLYAVDDLESVDTLIARLTAMKKSSSQREQDVFQCMIQSLFDEYRFFQKYPEKELQTTAALFGGLIRSNLIVDQSLGEALRLFLDATSNPPGQKLTNFGLQVLHAISHHLPTWPQYCRNLLEAAKLSDKDPELASIAMQIVQESGDRMQPDFELQGPVPVGETTSLVAVATTGVQLAEQALEEPVTTTSVPGEADSAKPGGSPFGTAKVQGIGQLSHLPGSPRLPGGTDDFTRPSVTTTQSAMDHKRAFQTVNAETLELALQSIDFIAPPNKVQDRIGFIINNLSNSNLDQKAKEMKELLVEEYWPWFCNYMVVKRAAQEQNFHILYASLLNALQLKDLWRMLVLTAYKYIKVLLASERIKTQSSERSLLKNLGSWLGRITIAQGQPVKHRDLDIKGIILEAYEQGKMIAVLPFVNKVLEPCKDSRVFRPPNPWITGILSLMAEIYQTEKLKLNLTFEIEMLFRTFNLQISDARLSKELVGRKRDLNSGTDYTIDKQVPDAAVLPARSVLGLPDAGSQIPGSVRGAGGQPAAMDDASPSMHSSLQGNQVRAPQPNQDQGLIGNYHNHIHINISLQPVAERFSLKRMVPVAVDRAVADIITPVVERSVTIACMTTQELILKDFAMESDEGRVRKAAHLMVSSLAGSLALVTCREPLRSSLAAQLRQLLTNAMEPAQIEQTVQIITSDNFELGCTIIEKSATDKAVRDINERLAAAFQSRQKGQAPGQQLYAIGNVLQGRFLQSLPEAMRPKAGHLNPQQQRIYEDFARIPRAPASSPAPGQASLPSGDHHNSFDEAKSAFSRLADAITIWQQRMDMLVAKKPNATYMPSPDGGDIAVLVHEVLDIVPEDSEDQGILVARKIFLHMFDLAGNSLHTTSNAAALGLLKSRLSSRLSNDLTATWTGLPDDRKWRKDIAEAMLRAKALNAPEVDLHLSKVLNLNRSTAQPVEFAVHLVRQCIVAEPIVSAAEFHNTLDVLQKLVVPQVPGSMAATLQQLIDQARQVNHVPAQKLTEEGDSPVLRAQISQLFDEWIQLSDHCKRDEAHDSFVAHLQHSGFLKGDEMTDRFFRIMTTLSVAHSLTNEAIGPRALQLSYLALDAYVRLIVLLVNLHSGGTPLLARAASILVACLHRDAELRSANFNGRPYFRIFLGLIQELSPPDTLDVHSSNLLTAVASALLEVQPLRVPGFAFPWLELISHRNFMAKLANDQHAWAAFQRLLIALLRFLEPYLRNAELTDSVRLLYKGTLRVLLVLLHDFPEFLCEYHFEICNVVPPSCIQMRNLILSAFPRNMRLPDPFTPNLKVDLLPEIASSPRFRPPVESLLPSQMRLEVDSFLMSREPAALVPTICARLVLTAQDVALSGTRYNVSLLNALAFYIGVQAIETQQQVQPGSSPVMHSPAMEMFQQIANDLDTEGRYLFLNALANQLRYPNNHTHYFSCVLLYLFAEAKQEMIQEQITRVLLERLIVNRPHPWGLLITFIELIKNPRYKFWSFNFTRCAGEIERLFESVARSCMGTGLKTEDEMKPLTNE